MARKPTDHQAMVRIPADLVGQLDRIAAHMQRIVGVDKPPEVSRAFVHHLALHQGVALLTRTLTGRVAALHDEAVALGLDLPSDEPTAVLMALAGWVATGERRAMVISGLNRDDLGLNGWVGAVRIETRAGRGADWPICDGEPNEIAEMAVRAFIEAREMEQAAAS